MESQEWGRLEQGEALGPLQSIYRPQSHPWSLEIFVLGSRPAQGAQSSCLPITQLMGGAVSMEDPGVPEHQRLPGVLQQLLHLWIPEWDPCNCLGGNWEEGDPFQGDAGVLQVMTWGNSHSTLLWQTSVIRIHLLG